MNYTIDECKLRENASEEDVAAILSLEGDWPETREGKCFIDCFLEEVGLVRGFKAINKNFNKNFSQFKDHKFYKRGFLALAFILIEQAPDDDSHEIRQMTEIFLTVKEKCDTGRSNDRCDNAFEFATCFDLVMESMFIGNDVSVSNELENQHSELLDGDDLTKQLNREMYLIKFNDSSNKYFDCNCI